jgi:hypothetical protein
MAGGMPERVDAERLSRLEHVANAVRDALAAAGLQVVAPGLAVPVTGIDLTRTLRAVWTEGRGLTGPALDLDAIARRSQ